jgi:hypothetical protein
VETFHWKRFHSLTHLEEIDHPPDFGLRQEALGAHVRPAAQLDAFTADLVGTTVDPHVEEISCGQRLSAPANQSRLAFAGHPCRSGAGQETMKTPILGVSSLAAHPG